MNQDLNWCVIPCEDKPRDKRLDKIKNKNLPALPATFLSAWIVRVRQVVHPLDAHYTGVRVW